MTLGVLFWLLFIIGILFNGYLAVVPAWAGARFGGVIYVVLLGILGWAVFGAAIK